MNIQVSIHSRRLGREIRFRHPCRNDGFQVSIHSRRLGREIHRVQNESGLPSMVSIHSRRLGREIRGPKCQPSRPPSFNPLPAIRPGDTSNQELEKLLIQVSIHSRRLGREIQPENMEFAQAAKGFNPLPAIRPGDTRLLLKYSRTT